MKSLFLLVLLDYFFTLQATRLVIETSTNVKFTTSKRASPSTNNLGVNDVSSPITTGYGFPVTCKTTSLTAGPKGPILLQDSIFLDEITHFDRERFPERVVHAKGGAGFGYFECLYDITNFTKAVVFSEIGKKTDVLVRFSTVGGELGSADTVRDPRGFAIKFYTEEGIWDLVCNDTPVFFIRDPMLFPSFIHSQKRHPATHLKNPDMFWDFLTLRPESTYQTLMLFSDKGIPDGFTFMDGFGGHTFKLVNAAGEAFWCKFHFKSDQGIKNLTVEEAERLAGIDPDYSIRNLYNAIDSGNYPSWTLYIQVMTLEEAVNYPWNVFDITKIWLESDYPLIPVGRLVLNRNPTNYFEQVEQAAFTPGRMIPGIQPSPDKMLQGRIFSYGDTQRHRLGPNFLQLPVNKSPYVTITNQQRDGDMCYYNQDGAPNYFPNSFGGSQPCVNTDTLPFEVDGLVDRYETKDDDNFSQPKIFYETELDDSQRGRLIENLANSLKNAKEFIWRRAVKNFSQVNQRLGIILEKRILELLA